MAREFEENDVKIASEHMSKSKKKSNDDEHIKEQLMQAHQSGEIERARSLGVIMAQTFSDAKGEYTFGQDMDETEEIQRERRVLLAFSVAYGFDKYSKNSLISRTALNVFYDALKRLDSDLYEDLNATGAFSFYYLAVRRGGDIEHAVGRTFAMLCSCDGDAVAAELGEALFCRFYSIVKENVVKLELDKNDK